MEFTTDVLAVVASDVCGGKVQVIIAPQRGAVRGLAGLADGKPSIALDDYTIAYNRSQAAGTYWHEIAHVAAGHVNRAYKSTAEEAEAEAFCDAFAERMVERGYGEGWFYGAMRGYMPQEAMTASARAGLATLLELANEPVHQRAAAAFPRGEWRPTW